MKNLTFNITNIIYKFFISNYKYNQIYQINVNFQLINISTLAGRRKTEIIL